LSVVLVVEGFEKTVADFETVVVVVESFVDFEEIAVVAAGSFVDFERTAVEVEVGIAVEKSRFLGQVLVELIQLKLLGPVPRTALWQTAELQQELTRID